MSKEVQFCNRDRFIKLGLTISALRRMKGWSQEELAERAKISRPHLSSSETRFNQSKTLGPIVQLFQAHIANMKRNQHRLLLYCRWVML